MENNRSLKLVVISTQVMPLKCSRSRGPCSIDIPRAARFVRYGSYRARIPRLVYDEMVHLGHPSRSFGPVSDLYFLIEHIVKNPLTYELKRSQTWNIDISLPGK